MYGSLTEKIIAYLRRTEIEGALWTSDIAYGVKAPTSAVLRRLRGLAGDGKVERVVKGGKGHPASWKISPSARA